MHCLTVNCTAVTEIRQKLKLPPAIGKVPICWMHHPPSKLRIGWIFTILQTAYLISTWVSLLNTYQYVYRNEEHCKMNTILAFDLDTRSPSSRPPGDRGSFSIATKRKKPYICLLDTLHSYIQRFFVKKKKNFLLLQVSSSNLFHFSVTINEARFS